MHAIFPIDITQLDVYRTEKVDRSHYQKAVMYFVKRIYLIISMSLKKVVGGNRKGKRRYY